MRKILLTCAACVLALTPPSRAEQGGSAHYMPGAAASFIDAFPGKPGGLATLNYFTYYGASAPLGRSLPLGGFLTADINASVYADTIAAIYQTKAEILGGGFAIGAAVPYVWVKVDGRAQRINPGGVPGPQLNASDRANGIGDITLYPFMLGWTNLVEDLKLDLRLGVYAPTGEYDKNDLANVGKNYWTFEPGIMASWLSSKFGTEVSLYSAVDINTENHDSDYTSGTSMHFDMTVAQHLPMLGGIGGVGVTGFFYKQVTGDSGSGAVLGEFEGRTSGVGPVISYIKEMGDTTFLSELKWLHETETKNRMEGDYIWFKFGFLF